MIRCSWSVFTYTAAAFALVLLVSGCSFEPAPSHSYIVIPRGDIGGSLEVRFYAPDDVVETAGGAFDYTGTTAAPRPVGGREVHRFELAGATGGSVEIADVPANNGYRVRLDWHGRDETRLGELADDGTLYEGSPSFTTHGALTPRFSAGSGSTTRITITAGRASLAEVPVTIEGPDVTHFEIIDADENTIDMEPVEELLDLGNSAEALELLNSEYEAAVRLRPGETGALEVLAGATIGNLLPGKRLQILVTDSEGGGPFAISEAVGVSGVLELLPGVTHEVTIETHTF